MPNNQTKKICPFMSTPEKSVLCSSACKLYRENRTNYECMFSELGAISWNTKGKNYNQQNNQNQNYQPY